MNSSMQKRVVVLGATGSIGTSTLDVIARHPERYRVSALTAHVSRDKLLMLCLQHRPDTAVIAHEDDASWLRAALQDADCETRVLHGEQALCDVAATAEIDIVVAAIMGGAGLAPTLAAVKAGHQILLANKESLVMAGSLFIDAARQSGARVLPVDSEHNAIFQCLPMPSSTTALHTELERRGVTRILLTASGGPFRGWSRDRLHDVTPAQACAHPNWSMGRKISVDSATMMNKGLEIIEACWLFGLTPDDVQVVVHPQSIVHSMVAYRDGSVLAQLGNPDMRTPIAHALAWPERIDSGVAPLDVFSMAQFEFRPPDEDAFPCLRLARHAMALGGTAPVVLNAANEVAVDAFLNEQISFTAIPELIKQVMDALPVVPVDTLDTIFAQDAQARDYAAKIVARQCSK